MFYGGVILKKRFELGENLKFLVDCFPVYSAKWPRAMSAPSDSGTDIKH